MPGFYVSNTKNDIELRDVYRNKLVREAIPCERIGTVKRSTLNKFMDDKAFYTDEKYIIVLDGYLLNKKDLLLQYGASDVATLIRKMYEKCGNTFFEDFRGCFAGAFIDKVEDKWIVFTNQIGDNPIFYYEKDGIFAAGSEVKYVLEMCRARDLKLTFNEDAAYQMLTYAFMAADDTYAKEIKRLHGGDYLLRENGVLSVKQYHRFHSDTTRFKDCSEDEIIDAIDKSFRNAVQLEWAKDDEYGYEHLADLSGGLDSRMNLWVAHELKPVHANVLTYSQAGYLDQKISEQIAYYWKDELIFKPLDDATFLYDIDIATELLGGGSLYAGITGGRRLLAFTNLDHYGIEHTGMVGDAILGSFYHNEHEMENKTPTGRYSEKLAARLPEKIAKLPNAYDNYEIYLMYVRGFHGACNSHLIRRNYTEVGSPFLNVEFMQMCYDIPVERRMNHDLYKKWIIKKYPKAADFKWEKIDDKITAPEIMIRLRSLSKRIPRKIKKIMGMKVVDKKGMNPLDYWIHTNQPLKDYMDSYEKAGYSYLPEGVSEELRKDMHDLYENGNANEKTMVLTVLSSTKIFFWRK